MFSLLQFSSLLGCHLAAPVSWAMIKAARGAMMFFDVSKDWTDSFVGLVNPIPRSLTGKANISLSSTEQDSRPLSAGIKSEHKLVCFSLVCFSLVNHAQNVCACPQK